MTVTIDTQNQHRFGPLNFSHMSSYSSHPHFTNPWASTSAPAGPGPQGGSQSLYVSSQNGTSRPHLNLIGLPKHTQHSSRTTGGTSLAPYASLPVSAASTAGDVYGRQHDLLPMSQDILSINRLQHPTTSAAPYDTAYTTSASPVTASYATSSTPYDQLGYAPAPMRGPYGGLAPEDGSRRYSQQSVQPDDRRTFQDALEASHGMMSLSQETPRNIYDVRARQRGSGESYGFPSTHSATSSVSSTGFSPYYGGSVDGSASDYSTAGSDIESLSGRTLPRPQGLLLPNQPPAPQSMMGSFNSKASSATPKKHKCKVCDKRFTRPSSLQTHMYSHTGEKPFKCEVEGCGRNFSVVSNLRRHRKVHKSHGEPQTPSETGSEDHHSDE